MDGRMTEPLRIFIGYDVQEATNYHVLSHSILRNARSPVSITPVARHMLDAIFTRKRGPLESTDFSISRFIVPWMCDYKGRALFMDSDMLVRCDIAELFELAAWGPPVCVCKHEYIPKGEHKKTGAVQTKYNRKNWSSLMLFDGALCQRLTPHYVNTAHGLALHQFEWADDSVGSIPLEWNWLVGEYPENPEAKILHFTLGTPFYVENQDTSEAQIWLDELELAVGSRSAWVAD